MRFFTSLLFMLSLATASWGQVVITEIMYNPPESGQDTYEYLELYNAGSNAVNLLGYNFTAGFDYTFTSGFNLGAGEYVVFAVDSIAFEAAFGFAAFQMTDGGLSNGGETITLADGTGAIVDEVTYDDSSPWDTGADGPGASLVLCDVTADNNDGANWDAAPTGTGVISNGVEILGNPGGASQCVEGPVVRFLDTEYEFGEGDGMVTIGVEIRDAASSTIEVEVDMGASTVTIGTDLNVSSGTLSFSGDNAIDTAYVTISIIDDVDPEAIEILALNLVNPSMGLNVDGIGASTTIGIVDNDTDVPALVINELMYNPPGSDDLYEYLELYNNGADAINVNGYYFTAGITDTLHDITIQPGEFLVLATDSVAYEENYGGPAYQWTDGGLSNGGESIELRDALGNIVDELTYSDTGEWPEAADGSGASLILCDPATDNSLAASWSAGMQPTGIFISGAQILGSPGSTNDCTPVVPMEYTPYTIGEITTNGPTGIADSLGVRAEITATVYGVNLRPSGLQFTLIDEENNGIGLFNSSGNYGYTVNEGDEVTVRGTISQFSGLTQINPDTVFATGNTNVLFDPTDVTVLDESTESQLVRITGLVINTVETAGGGLNVTMMDEAGANTYLMRVDLDTDITEDFINNIGLGGGLVNLTGIGGQFDGSEPHDEGYQILPRYQTDLEVIVGTTEPAWGANTLVFPNPVRTQFNIQTEVELDQIVIRNELGQAVLQLEATNRSVNVSQLAAGLYLVELHAAGERVIRKLIKQ